MYKRQGTDRIAFEAGTAQRITENNLLTCICLFTAEPMDTEVIRIIETAFVPGVLNPMEFDLLGDGGGVFTQESGDILKGAPLIKGMLNV